MTTLDIGYPKLRPLDIRPIDQQGRPYFLLRDPLQLAESMLMVPQALGPLLVLLDGTRADARALAASLLLRFRLRVSEQVVAQLLTALDEGLLLENERYRQAQAQALLDYRNARFRQPMNAGQSYPEDASELRRLFDSYLEQSPDGQEHLLAPGQIRGLVSPHIDYARGGAVYAAVWKRAAQVVQAADLAVVLGTDHYGGNHLITLTAQNYATPLGVLPTPRPIVEALAAALGQEAALGGELHHRGEHSIELAVAWLQHMRGGQPCEVVPILCGSFSSFVEGDADAERDETIGALVQTLRQAMEGRRTLVVAAGDLAHVGPAFDGDPLDDPAREALRQADDELIEQMSAGSAAGFLEAIRQVQDRNNVCGVPPIYLALRLLGQARGERVAYDHCPADEENTSTVSVCGVVLG